MGGKEVEGVWLRVGVVRVWGGLEGQRGEVKRGLATSKRQCKPHYSIICWKTVHIYILWCSKNRTHTPKSCFMGSHPHSSNHISLQSQFLYEANLCGVT